MVILVQHNGWSVVGTCFTDYACPSNSDWLMPLYLQSFKNKPYHALSTCMLTMHSCFVLFFWQVCMHATTTNLLYVSIQLVEF